MEGKLLSAMMKNERISCEALLKILIDSHADMNIKQENQASPLHLASYMGYESLVRWLLNHGAKIDERDALGQTALHVAAKYGYGRIVARLVYGGADMDLACKDSYTPLDYATFEITDRYHRPLPHNPSDAKDDFYTYKSGAVRDDFKEVYYGGYGYYGGIISLFIEHFIAEMALGFSVSAKNRRYIDRYRPRDDVLKECRVQIAKMKTTMVGNSKISFYDVLSKGTNVIAFHMKNEGFRKGVENKIWSDDFSKYRSVFLRRLMQGSERADKNLLGRSFKPLDALAGFVVPHYCALEIFDNLSNKDLENLIEAYPSGE